MVVHTRTYNTIEFYTCLLFCQSIVLQDNTLDLWRTKVESLLLSIQSSDFWEMRLTYHRVKISPKAINK